MEQSYLLAQSLSYNAPLPPPEWLGQYNQIVPGAADQMIQDVHDQSAHRRDIERKESDANIVLSKRGQWIGGGLVALVIVGGFGLAWFEKSIPGGVILALTGLAALAAVFVGNSIGGRRRQQNAEPQPPAQQ